MHWQKKGTGSRTVCDRKWSSRSFIFTGTGRKTSKAMIVIPAFSEYEQALKTVGCEILYHEVKKKIISVWERI